MSSKALPRRIFLKQVASASGALAVGAAATAASAAPAAEPVVGYQSLSPEEGAFTESWTGYVAGEELCKDLMVALADLAEERPDTADLPRGRTFAGSFH
ncbi:MAG TPA: hypothetical protein VNP36_18840 [Burkholderiales bacterium]|nr:hypothetical protein [Burkholderiales bacterium]